MVTEEGKWLESHVCPRPITIMLTGYACHADSRVLVRPTGR
jgi:hypothetical protein